MSARPAPIYRVCFCGRTGVVGGRDGWFCGFHRSEAATDDHRPITESDVIIAQSLMREGRSLAEIALQLNVGSGELDRALWRSLCDWSDR
jgi:hypothetical protein